MRALKPALEERVRRADPEARVIVEATRVTAEDVKNTFDEWNGADAAPNVATLEDGGVKLVGSLALGAQAAQAAADNVVTDLDDLEPFEVVEIEWTTLDALRREMDRLTVRVDPDVASIGVDVTLWRARLFRLARVLDDGDYVIEPLLNRSIEAIPSGGSAPEDIVFDLRGQGGSPVRPGDAPDDDGIGGFQNPRTIIFLWALKGEGAAATNVAWQGDSGASEESGTGYVARHRRYQPASDDQSSQQGGAFTDVGAGTGIQRFKLDRLDFTAGETVAFTAPGNRLDLGSAPTDDVEVVARGQEFGDSSLLFELAEPGSGTWHTVADGDLVGQDNAATGGNDLSALAVRQDYDARVTLTPGGGGDISPVARIFGVREIAISDLDGVARVTGLSYSTDPLTLRSEIAEPVISIARDGELDYEDAATELLSGEFIGELTFRVWIGHDDLDRKDWLLIDEFLVEDYDSAGDLVHVQTLSPLALLRTTIPDFDALTDERSPTTYTNQTLKSVFEDLLDSQIALPGRHRGAPVEDQSTLVSRTIEESDGKRELDAVAYLAGGSVISSQGRAKFVRLYDDQRIEDQNPAGVTLNAQSAVARIPVEEARILTLTPGFRARVMEFFVPYGWDDDVGDFSDEAYTAHADAVNRLGSATVEAPERLDDDIARWVPDQTTANALGQRVVDSMGTGLITVEAFSSYPYPELELGDVVTIETDKFVARDPNTPKRLRGMLNLTGPVVGLDGPWGRRIRIWVQSYANIIASSKSIVRRGFTDPRVTAVVVGVDSSGVADANFYGNAAVGGFQWAFEIAGPPTESEVLASPNLAAGPTAHVTDIAHVEVSQRVFVGVIGWERADGTGARSPLVIGDSAFQSRGGLRPPTPFVTRRVSGGTGTLAVSVDDPDGTLVGGIRFEDPAGSGAYVEDPTKNSDGEYTRDYDISGGAVSPKIRAIWDPGTGTTRTIELGPFLLEEDPLPEILFVGFNLLANGEILLSVRCDDDSEIVRWAGDPDSAPDEATVLAEADVTLDVNGNAIIQTGITIDEPGGDHYISVIPLGPDAPPRPQGAMKSILVQRPAVNLAGSVAGIIDDRGRPAIVFSGQSVDTKGFAYKASKTAFDTDDAIGAVKVLPQWPPVLGQGYGIHKQLVLPDGPKGWYSGAVGWVRVDGVEGQYGFILDGSSDPIFLESSNDVIYVIAWFFETEDCTSPAGPPRRFQIGPKNIDPLGRVQIRQDTYGNALLFFRGDRNVSSVVFKTAAITYVTQSVVDAAIPDDPEGGTVVNLGAENEYGQTFGEAEFDLVERAVTVISVWFYSGANASGLLGKERVVVPTAYFAGDEGAVIVSKSVKVARHDLGGGVLSATKADYTLQLRDPLGTKRSSRVRLWINKASTNDPDPNVDDPDGYVDLPAPVVPQEIGPLTTFQLTGGGTDELLSGVTVDPQRGKTAWIEVLSWDPTLFATPDVAGPNFVQTTLVDSLHLSLVNALVNADANLRLDAAWSTGEELGETKEKAEDAHALYGGSAGGQEAKIVADVVTAGDFLFEEASLIGFGDDPQNPGSREDTIRYGASGLFFSELPANAIQSAGAGDTRISSASDTVVGLGNGVIPLAAGQELVAIRYGYDVTVVGNAPSVVVSFYEAGPDGVGSLIFSNTHSQDTGGSVIEHEQIVSVSVLATKSYKVRVALTPDGNRSNARFSYVEVSRTRSEVTQTV